MTQCKNKFLNNFKHIMVIAGEPSGDLHGAGLLKQIKKIDPDIRITGIGGDMMNAQGMDIFFHINKLSVMGVTEVISRLSVIKKAFDIFKKRVIWDRPSLLIVIDYPGFNLKAAAFAWRQKIPVLYYIIPKVWAWNYSRIKKIRKYVTHAALILPFEESIFKKEKIPSTFVGHPLLDYLYEIPSNSFTGKSSNICCDAVGGFPDLPYGRYKGKMIKQDFHVRLAGKDEKKDRNEFIIGLLPGSREAEIDHLFEIMLESAEIIHGKMDKVKFIVSKADSINKEKFYSILGKHNQNILFEVITGSPVKIFGKSDFLVAASGTVTLEAAIWGIPMVIIYKMSSLSYFFAKRFVKVKYAGLANIIAGREIVPELLQNHATPGNISDKVISLLNQKALFKMRTRLLMVRKMLGSRGAAERTARIALNMLDI